MSKLEVKKSRSRAGTTPHGPVPDRTGLAISGQEGSPRPGSNSARSMPTGGPRITCPSARSISATTLCFGSR